MKVMYYCRRHREPLLYSRFIIMRNHIKDIAHDLALTIGSVALNTYR